MRNVLPFFYVGDSGDAPGSEPEGALGHDLGTWLVEREGQVVTVDPVGELDDRYVNASVLAFSEAVEVFGDWYASLGGEVPTEETMGRLRMEFDRIDPTALAGAGNWWHEVIEQVEFGIL